MTRRPALLRLVLASALGLGSGCGGETPAAPAGTDWVVDAGADTTGVAADLAVFGTDAVDRAFARLAAQPYRVTVTMAELGPEGDLYDADTLGLFEQTLEVRPGEAPRALGTTARGSLADSVGLDPARLLPRDPFPALLPDDPPFLDRRTRGAYRVFVQPTNISLQTVAEVAEPDAERPLVRSAAVARGMMGQRTLSVTRVSTSAIYDETSLAVVKFGPGRSADPYAELPRRVTTHLETATPLRRRRLATTWNMTPLAPPQSRTTNTREP